MNEKQEVAEMIKVLRSKGFYPIELGGGVVFITQDRYISVNPDPKDQEAMSSFEKMPIRLDSKRMTPEQREARVKQAVDHLPSADLEELSEAANSTWQWFWQNARVMPAHQATVVRRMRCEQRLSWRGVARRFQEIYLTSGWYSPASNQVAGMALCKGAAEKLGEDWTKDPWN